MSNNDTAGLSIQDAWNEAEAEGTLSEEPSESADTTPAEPAELSDSEQSAVETPEKAGLFNGLEGDKNKSQVEQPEDNEGLYEVDTVNGVEEVTLEELKAGYMRKADYTKKRQEDAAKAEEADKALVLYNALQQNPMETVQKLWEKVRAGQPVQADVETPSGETSQPDIEQMVNERVQAILNEDPRIKSIQQEREMERVDAVFKDIENDWGLDQPLSDEDKEYVINKAIEWDSSDLEAVFAKLMHLRQKAQAEAENVDSNSTSQGYGGQQSVGLQKPTEPKKFGSIRDAINETLADEGMNENDLQVAISAL